MNYERLVRRFRNDDRIWTTDRGDGSKFRRVFEKALDHHYARLKRIDEERNAADPLRQVLKANSWLCRTDFA